MSSAPAEKKLDPAAYPHVYTSGRWLRHDKLQRASRYIESNFNALCKRVIELCPGAKSVAKNEKVEVASIKSLFSPPIMQNALWQGCLSVMQGHLG
jgi:hypothetical protein